MPTLYVVPGRTVMALATSYSPFAWPRDPVTNVSISPFGQFGAFPDNQIVPYGYTGGQAVAIEDQAEADRLVELGFASTSPTVTPVPPGPPGKIQGVVASYVARGTVYCRVPALPQAGPLTAYTPGQRVLLSQSDTDHLTSMGFLSATWPPVPPS